VIYIEKEIDILSFLQKQGIISLDDVQKNMKLVKQQQILKNHPYKIWEGTNGRWYTNLPDDTKKDGRRKIAKSSEEKIKKVIIDYYEEKKQDSRMTFEKMFNKWKKFQLDFGLSANTILKYDSDYKRFFNGSKFAETNIDEINEENIKVFVASKIRDKKIIPRTAKTLIWYIKSVFKSAFINKLIIVNPCDFLDSKTMIKYCTIPSEKTSEQRTVSDDQLKLLYEQLYKDKSKKPNYIPTYAIELATLTGMRSGELSGLMWSDIYAENGYIEVCHSEKYNRDTKEFFIDDTKTHKQRHIPLTDEIESLLNEIKSVTMKYGYITDFVFSNEFGRVHARVISDCIRNKSIQIGIDIKSIHAIRRTFSSKLKCMGVSTTITSSILGHTEEVNNNCYTYDISNMDYKKSMVSKVTKSMRKYVTNECNQDSQSVTM